MPDRDAMDAILLVLRTGMQWNALDLTGPASSSSAHRRFQEWERAGVFHEIWRQGLVDYDEQVGIDWAWLAADGAMTKAPLGGPKTGPNPTDPARARVSRKTFYEHFDGKEACFSATFDECVSVLRTAGDDALDPDLPIAEQVHAMLAAYVAVLAGEPKIAKTNLVEVYAAGPRAAQRRRESMERFAAVVKGLHQRAREGRADRELSDTDYELTVGAISSAITIRVATGEVASLPRLVPELAAFVLRTMET